MDPKSDGVECAPKAHPPPAYLCTGGKRIVMKNTLIAILVLVVLRGVTTADEGNEMDRTIVVERVVTAPVDSVWNVWTTSEGIESFFAVKADVQLAIVPIKNLDELFEIIETKTTTFKDVYLPLI